MNLPFASLILLFYVPWLEVEGEVEGLILFGACRAVSGGRPFSEYEGPSVFGSTINDS